MIHGIITSRIKITVHRFDIKIVIKTKYNLRNFLRKMKSNIDRIERPQQLYRIPRECGGEYIGKSSRSLKIRVRDYEYNLRQGLFDKSKLASHAFVGGHKIDRTKKPHHNLRLTAY